MIYAVARPVQVPDPVFGNASAVKSPESNTSAVTNEDLARYKYVGIALVVTSVVLTFSTSMVGIAVVMGVLGLALYARARNRSLWLCAVGLLPVLGPLIGLWMLSSKKKNRPAQSTSDYGIGNIVGCAIFVLFTYDISWQFFLSVALPDDQWHPRPSPYGVIPFMLSPLILFIIGVSLARVDEYRKIFTRGHRKPIVIVEMVFVGLFAFALFQTFHMLSKVRDVMEVRSESVLSGLQVGMSRQDVEILILKANAAMIGTPQKEWLAKTNRYQDSLYAAVQDALESAQHGAAVDFGTLKERKARWLFVPSENEREGSNQTFRRVHTLGPFHDVSYEILVSYDEAERVQAALYVSSAYYDGPGPCRVIDIRDSRPAWTSGLCTPLEYGKWKTTSR